MYHESDRCLAQLSPEAARLNHLQSLKQEIKSAKYLREMNEKDRHTERSKTTDYKTSCCLWKEVNSLYLTILPSFILALELRPTESDTIARSLTLLDVTDRQSLGWDQVDRPGGNYWNNGVTCFPAVVYCAFVSMSLCVLGGGLSLTGGWDTSVSCSLGDMLLNILPRSADFSIDPQCNVC